MEKQFIQSALAERITQDCETPETKLRDLVLLAEGLGDVLHFHAHAWARRLGGGV
jgi:hypothetical protein